MRCLLYPLENLKNPDLAMHYRVYLCLLIFSVELGIMNEVLLFYKIMLFSFYNSVFYSAYKKSYTVLQLYSIVIMCNLNQCNVYLWGDSWGRYIEQ